MKVAALGTAVVEVAAGAWPTCAREQDGTIWCWGRNVEGQLGNGTASGQSCGGTPCEPLPVKTVLSCP